MANFSSLQSKFTKIYESNPQYRMLSIESAMAQMVKDGVLTKAEYEQLMKTSAFGFGFNSDISDSFDFGGTTPVEMYQNSPSGGIETIKDKSVWERFWNNLFVDMAKLPVNYQIIPGEYTILSHDSYQAFSYLSDIFNDAENSFEQQRMNEGWVSDQINADRERFNYFLEEILGIETRATRSEVAEKIADTSRDVELLNAAMRGALVDGNGNSVDFETAFEATRGVKYSKEKIELCQKKSETYAQAEMMNRAIDELVKNLQKYSYGSSELDNVKEFNKNALKTFSLLGLTDQGQINEVLSKIGENIGYELQLVKQGTKGKAEYGQDFVIEFKNNEGRFLPLTPEISRAISNTLVSDLNDTKRIMLGLSLDCPEEYIAEHIAQLKTDYEKSFKEAYGEKDLSVLAKEYISAQQDWLMGVNLAVNIGLIVTSMLTGGATAAVMTGLLMTQPLQALEMFTDENAETNLESYGKMLISQLPWMGAGVVMGKLGDLARSFVKLKGLQRLAANAGQSLDDFVKLMSEGGNLSDDITKALTTTRRIADASGMSIEMALDLAVTKFVQPEGATTQDWIMSFIGALAGSSLNKNISDFTKTKDVRAVELQKAFPDLRLSAEEAGKIISKIDEMVADGSWQQAVAKGADESAPTKPRMSLEADDLYSIQSKKEYIGKENKNVILDKDNATILLKDFGFNEKSILEALSRLKNPEGEYNAEIIVLLNELKKVGFEENFAISITRRLVFQTKKSGISSKIIYKKPSLNQLNEIIDCIKYLKQQDMNEITLINIIDALKMKDGNLNNNLLNKKSLDFLKDFYLQYSNKKIFTSPNWLNSLTNEFLIDNTGNLNEINIKFVKNVLETAPQNISILRQVKDKNGVCSKYTQEIIDYAESKSKELEVSKINFNIKFLKDKNGKLDLKNEECLNKIVEKLQKNGFKQDQLEILLSNDGTIDFNTIDTRVDELIGIYQEFKETNPSTSYSILSRIYNKMNNNNNEAKFEILQILSKWKKATNCQKDFITEPLMILKTEIEYEQIKTIEKIFDFYGYKNFRILLNCDSDCYKKFDNLFEKLKQSNISIENQNEIIFNSNKLNIDIANKLCFDKELNFPVEHITKFLNSVDTTNIDFINTILENKELYVLLKENLSKINDNFKYKDLISSIEIQYLNMKSGNGNIGNEVIIKNFEKLNEKFISKSELYMFLEENPNITSKDIDIITDKIISYYRETDVKLKTILNKIEGQSLNEKLDQVLSLLENKNLLNYEKILLLRKVQESSDLINNKQVELLKDVFNNYEEKELHAIFDNILNSTLDNELFDSLSNFYLKLKDSDVDVENQIALLVRINKDNAKIFNKLCFDETYNFTSNDIIKISEMISKDNKFSIEEVLSKCKEKQLDKKYFVDFVVNNKESLNLLNNVFVKDFVLNNIENVETINSSISSNNFVEVKTKGEVFFIKTEEDGSGRVFAKEKLYKSKMKGTVGTELKFENGISKREEYSGLPGLEVDGYIETILDKNGNKISRTLTKPSKTNPGVLVVIKEIFNEDGSLAAVREVGKVKNYGSTKQGRRIDREFVSPSGTKSRQIIVDGPKGKMTRFESGGKVFERKMRMLDDNTMQSKINDNLYITKYFEDKIEIILTRKDGSSETVTLDGSQIDLQLLPLFKQLTGDYLYVLAKTGTKVGVDLKRVKNAYFSPASNSIGISKELVNDPFTFAHEFGHMLDLHLIKGLYDDANLKAIFEQELNDYKMESTQYNETEISYFISKNHVNAEGCLTEIIAETNAIVAGMVHDSNFVLLRAKILQENFPKTLTYIATKMEESILNL